MNLKVIKEGNMNIFVLHKEPAIAAMYHCDKHVTKMTLESAQMLCTVLHQNEVEDVPYLPVHPKHPCTIWAGESLSNWLWLKELAKFLDNEYIYRYDKGHHKSWEVIESLPNPPIEDKGLTPFAQAMPKKYKHDNPVIAYRNYYMYDKARFATWKSPAEKPRWYRRKDNDE